VAPTPANLSIPELQVVRVNAPRDVLSEEECAQLLGVSIRTLRRWANLRKGPPRAVFQRMVIYRRDALLNWIAKLEK
jgi:DNA-binding transcriptional regulator YiaG